MPPVSMTRTSCIRSATVCRSPSRLAMMPRGGAAFTPSVESIVPLPSWSMPRPPSGIVTGRPAFGMIVSVPREPPPCPTTLMAIVAMPWLANVEATASGAPCLLSVKPCPKIATGQPPAGAGSAGMIRLKYRVLVDWTAGTPVSVPIGGMNFSAVSPSGDVEPPNAIAAMARVLAVVEKVLERLALDTTALGVAHPVGHHQEIACVLVEELVGLGVERVGGRIPHDLIDSDRIAAIAVAQSHEEHRAAAH